MELVTEALEAKSEDDIDRVLPKLRTALREHIRLARESLKARATVLQTRRSRKR